MYLFWEGGKEGIPRRPCVVSAEPTAGLDLTNSEILTWDEIKSLLLNPRSRPGALFCPFWQIHINGITLCVLLYLASLNSMFVKFVYVMACSYSLFSSLCSRRSTSCFVNKVLLKQGQAHLFLYCLQLLSHHNGRVGLQQRPYSCQIFAIWHLTEKHSCTCLLVT